MTDSGRAVAMAGRIRRYVDMVDYLRRHRRWVPLPEVVVALKIGERLARRDWHALEAAGVIEVLWGWGITPSVARALRIKKEPRQ